MRTSPFTYNVLLANGAFVPIPTLPVITVLPFTFAVVAVRPVVSSLFVPPVHVNPSARNLFVPPALSRTRPSPDVYLIRALPICKAPVNCICSDGFVVPTPTNPEFLIVMTGEFATLDAPVDFVSKTISPARRRMRSLVSFPLKSKSSDAVFASSNTASELLLFKGNDTKDRIRLEQ